MLIKPFPHGKSKGNAAIDYLLRLDYFWRKEKPPEILRGDPEITRELVNSIDREWKFTAGVCSWSGDDTVTSDDETEVIDRFEELAFAGLEPDQYDILWVRHIHANHHELHFVIPRMELSTGKAFNAFPPGWEKDFGHLRDYLNTKHNWTRPNDPERKRMFTPNNADIIEARLTRWGQNQTKQEKENTKDIINEYLRTQIENGLIQNRSDIITSLREIGLDINRESKNFITVMDSESNQKIRLKGGIYESEWQLDRSSWSVEREDPSRATKDRAANSGYIEKCERELTKTISRRAKYNKSRYIKEYFFYDKENEFRESNLELVIRESMDSDGSDRDSSLDRVMRRAMVHSGLVGRNSELKYSSTSQLGGNDKGTAKNTKYTTQGDIWCNPVQAARKEIHIHSQGGNNDKNDKSRWNRISQTGVLNHEQERTGADSAGHSRTISNRDKIDRERSNKTNRNIGEAIKKLRKEINRIKRFIQGINSTVKRTRGVIKKSSQIAKKRQNITPQGLGR